jgi:hypothetical protein
MLHFSPLQWTEMVLTIAAVVLQVIVLFSSVRAYRAKGTRPFQLFMWACICWVVPRVSLFASDAIRGFLSPDHMSSHPRYTLPWWRYPLVEIAQIFFCALIILALRSFLREPNVSPPAASNQVLEPTAGYHDDSL